ncbi:ATP-grasp domain-containing protein [Streptomyces sp. B21-083]|uniref:ATP-grasp domain-containing protein n=1 Tax=Streptomyces sp. B21-083 TaxID=3039410 RepID=UPI002FF34CA7
MAAVLDRLPRRGTVAVDAASLSSTLRDLDLQYSTLLDRTGEPVCLRVQHPARGWIRRLAPAGWDTGAVLGSHAAARLAARTALLATLLRDDGLTWLCHVDALFAAENKIVQYRAARAAGLRTPNTVISANPSALAGVLGERFVLKPLGPGNFTDADGHERVVHAQTVTAADLAGTDLLDAPFLAQEHLTARTHLRIVTVGDRAWSAELDADGLPLDWRQSMTAHHAFRPSSRWPETERAALELAERLGTGFTCQDWIVDAAGPAFLDLNPGGQWLFLPDSMTAQIADRLAGWLKDD